MGTKIDENIKVMMLFVYLLYVYLNPLLSVRKALILNKYSVIFFPFLPSPLNPVCSFKR